MDTFQGNTKVVQIWDKNLDHDPPYFVMKYYEDGDLLGESLKLQGSLVAQEQCFLKAIDCVQELHSRGEFHRDIKPHNFLREGEQIVVSDLGLSTEIGSSTAFTSSSMSWGTPGYIPPEFLTGNFKHADAAGDIYMLGKTFYVLLTGRTPLYMTADGIPAPLFHVIERSCSISKANRYQTLADLRQSIVLTYDVLLGRTGGEVHQLLSVIKDKFETSNQYETAQISELVEKMGLQEESKQIESCTELPKGFFAVIAQPPLIDRLSAFLAIYEIMVDAQNYTWGYAEVIASRMRLIFDSANAPSKERVQALDLAVKAAQYMYRFAAMDTCKAMVRSVHDEELGLHVAALIIKHRDIFLSDIEPSECHSDAVKNALFKVKPS